MSSQRAQNHKAVIISQRTGSVVERCSPSKPCSWCLQDGAFLRRGKRPYANHDLEVRVVDLFSGCGGMTLGISEAARRLRCQPVVRLAVDANPDCMEIYRANFACANAQVTDISALFNGVVGAVLSDEERSLARIVGRVDILMGGPPCQGHSDLNNHTRRKDPKNALYLKMARATEVLRPKVVIVENVANVQRDSTGIVERTVKALVAAGYRVARRVLDLRRVGIPQSRKRYVLIASRIKALDPHVVLAH